jgi:hypothetical protein
MLLGGITVADCENGMKQVKYTTWAECRDFKYDKSLGIPFTPGVPGQFWIYELEQLCPSVPQNSARKAKRPGDFLGYLTTEKAYEYFGFSTVGGKTYRS